MAQRYRLRATRDQRYNTRMLRAGDVFETPSGTVRKLYLSKGGVEDITGQPEQPPGPTPTEVRRMPKADLAEVLRERGEEVDEDEFTRPELIEMVLGSP